MSDAPAEQQPNWADASEVERVRDTLAQCPALVSESSVRRLRLHLARVSAGERGVVQAGDCAEDPALSDRASVERHMRMLDELADALEEANGRPAVRVGRIAGQAAKPRSSPTEHVDGWELPVYRGHMVNAPGATTAERRPDPWRMFSVYRSSRATMRRLGRVRADSAERAFWTSHEALVLDYEYPLVRPTGDGGLFLASTHWPWIGERTRQLDGAHVALMSQVVNPVAVKIGPGVRPSELRALCQRLDPGRRPGRLTLVVRMGAERIAERLPRLVATVQGAGHPAIWLSDPMHGNTVRTPNGHKTRYLRSMRDELSVFRDVLAAEGAVAGGVHLESTPDPVVECVPDEHHADRVGHEYTSLCDPRLTTEQAVHVLGAWRRGGSPWPGTPDAAPAPVVMTTAGGIVV